MKLVVFYKIKNTKNNEKKTKKKHVKEGKQEEKKGQKRIKNYKIITFLYVQNQDKLLLFRKRISREFRARFYKSVHPA